MVIPPQFNSAGHFHEGRAWVRIGGKYGYIDKYGTLVIPNEFTWAGNFHSGRAAVMVNEVGAYIDLAGKVVIQLSPENYEAVPPSFSEGLAPKCKEGKWGYIDIHGEWKVFPAYDSAGAFSLGLAGVTVDCRDGYIDCTGAWLIPPQFDLAYVFRPNGNAWVKIGRFEGSIDRTGRSTGLLAIAQKLRRWGLM
jgi:hypothetical protein